MARTTGGTTCREITNLLFMSNPLGSLQTLRENRLERFSTEQQQIFIERTLAERIPAYEVEIWQLDLTNNQSMLLYHADAYAIGRLMPAPDGITLFFSEIPNMDDELVNAIVDNVTVDVGTWPEPIPPLLYRLNLADDSVELIATDLSSATINFPAYERMMLDESQQRP